MENVALKKKQQEQALKRQNRREQEVVKAVKSEEDHKKNFFAKLDKSKDLADNLPELVDFLQKYTESTGVYIGRLQYPDRSIKIDDDDKAHLDYDAPQVIKFIHASKNHEFMTDAVLPSNVGVTHDCFLPEYSRLDKTRVTQAEDGTEEVTELELMERFKHVYVKEVVREPRMNFQRVPKLGSYMAVPLVYKSCLFDEALTEAVNNFKDVRDRRDQQEQD